MPTMPNSKLGKLAIKEIRECIERCTNSRQISAEVERLSKHYGLSKSQIYARTKDIRDKRKDRSDKGKRIADLMSHPGLKFAASLVVAFDITPSEALQQARLEGYEIPVELETFRRYMNEHEINKKTRLSGKTAYRSFEADRPGRMFQFDVSGTKQRWYDTKTRKIITVSELDVSENHPNEKPNRVKVWRFKLIDDNARRVFTRYYAVAKPNGSHVVDFLLQAYEELGVPEILYCDNDAVIKYARNAAAVKFIDKALENEGGYKMWHHLPGNARATGKIERQHQESEKSEKLIGLFLARGRNLTIEDLQEFAKNKDAEYNNTRHRVTGQTPMERWNARPHLVRKLDYAVLRSALLADEYDITIKGNLTFDLLGQTYQLPTDQNLQNLYERQQSTKKKLKVYFSAESDFYTLIDFEDNPYDIAKMIFAPDVAMEFKSTAESRGEKNRKSLKEFAMSQAKAEAEQSKQGFIETPITYFDTANVVEIESQKKSLPGVIQFPTPTINVTDKIIDSLPIGRKTQVQSDKDKYAGQLISWYDGVRKFKEFFATIAECKEVLDTVYPSRDEYQPETLVRETVEGYLINRPKLRIAK